MKKIDNLPPTNEQEVLDAEQEDSHEELGFSKAVTIETLDLTENEREKEKMMMKHPEEIVASPKKGVLITQPKNVARTSYGYVGKRVVAKFVWKPKHVGNDNSAKGKAVTNNHENKDYAASKLVAKTDNAKPDVPNYQWGPKLLNGHDNIAKGKVVANYHDQSGMKLQNMVNKDSDGKLVAGAKDENKKVKKNKKKAMSFEEYVLALIEEGIHRELENAINALEDEEKGEKIKLVKAVVEEEKEAETSAEKITKRKKRNKNKKKKNAKKISMATKRSEKTVKISWIFLGILVVIGIVVMGVIIKKSAINNI